MIEIPQELHATLATLTRAAECALSRWPAPAGARLSLINVSENVTYAATAPGWRAILRVHRPAYHSRAAIRSELAWAEALRRDSGVETPEVIPGLDGAALQTVSPAGGPARDAVMFRFIEGAHPAEDGDLGPAFRQLGEIAAHTHLHSVGWRRPAGFERFAWDVAAIFGPRATWGDWRDAPNLTAPARATLEAVEALIRRRLAAFGRSPARYGLIHADMRLANIIMKDDAPRLIDFDDCGFGWFVYDFAAALSFIEDHRQARDLKEAWITGYRTLRPLPEADRDEIDTMVMLRRMALLAWIGSHAEAPEPMALAADFARVTAELGEVYIASHGP